MASKPRYIYVLRDQESDVGKVGMSDNVEQRRQTLQYMTGRTLDIVYVRHSCKPRLIEIGFKAVARQACIGGEWFEMEDEWWKLTVEMLDHMVDLAETAKRNHDVRWAGIRWWNERCRRERLRRWHALSQEEQRKMRPAQFFAFC